MSSGDPQFEWRDLDGTEIEAPENARTYVDIARARMGPLGRVVMRATGDGRWRVEMAELSVPTAFANSQSVRPLPTDRRQEIARAFRAEVLPVDFE